MDNLSVDQIYRVTSSVSYE